MSKIWNWKFAIKAIAAVPPGLIAVVVPLELWQAWTVPHEYPFGVQGAAADMWTYDSQLNYLMAYTAIWFASAPALWALLFTQRSLRLRWLCGTPFLVVWALLMYDGSRLIH